ncbi:hypothetical protein [Alloactinosynnema sp. L-07]|uniref:ferredoxin n=1 Tax=Alloactinosynnema sp. L-07 TaxID=1653480 RepID=UPI00065EF766|nr:ferredoxin [Alloactinosynnema sp. L-07]CRK56721.1 hypothetical protein [Alloactinosynnema sp. L-07]
MITRDEIREILSTCRSMDLPPDIEDDAELVIDSFTLVTIQAALEDRHGLVVDPRFEDLRLFTSIANIHAFLSRNFPDSAPAPRIVIDQDRCIGTGHCAFTAPVVFSQDDDGLSTVLPGTPAILSDPAVKQAVLGCPVRAISIAAIGAD